MYETQIAAGIRYIESEGITDWRTKLAAAYLYMASGHNCVIGNLFGEYFTYLNENNLDRDWAVAHGFQLSSGARLHDYDILTQEWTAVVNGNTPALVEV